MACHWAIYLDPKLLLNNLKAGIINSFFSFFPFCRKPRNSTQLSQVDPNLILRRETEVSTRTRLTGRYQSLLSPLFHTSSYPHHYRCLLCCKRSWLSFLHSPDSLLWSCSTLAASSKQCPGFKLNSSPRSLREAHSKNSVISQRIYSFLSSFRRSLCKGIYKNWRLFSDNGWEMQREV